jgi:hypothetical protein
MFIEIIEKIGGAPQIIAISKIERVYGEENAIIETATLVINTEIPYSEFKKILAPISYTTDTLGNVAK